MKTIDSILGFDRINLIGTKKARWGTIALLTFMFLVGGFLFDINGAQAATSIYYSVGSSNTTDYKTGSPTISIDGSGNATFSVAQTNNSMGVGDVINYNGQQAYITAKTSTSIWTVETAIGALPPATSPVPVTSITHVFSTLKSALGDGIAGNVTSSNFLNTSDLVANNYVLNVSLYNDTGTRPKR